MIGSMQLASLGCRRHYCLSCGCLLNRSGDASSTVKKRIFWTGNRRGDTSSTLLLEELASRLVIVVENVIS